MMRVGKLRRARPGELRRRAKVEAKAHARATSGGAPVSAAERHARERDRVGHDLEHQAIAAFSSGEFPRWFLRVRPPTREEDWSGIDLWVDTDAGPFPVQVKSSAARAMRFREEHPLGGIAVVVLHPAMSDATIRGIILQHVDSERRARKQSRIARASAAPGKAMVGNVKRQSGTGERR